jgi:serine/threonine-protein kinase
VTDPLIGRTIAHYRIRQKLGGGGMGEVYLAEDTRLERTVALKFLPESVSRDPDAKERFMKEARAASGLDHPNICTIHSVDETEDGQVFIVMAYYEGKTLQERLERGPLPIAVIVDTARQVVEGLRKAHERGIVHRDIKPANLIRAADGVTKILDFGLAKLIAAVEPVHESRASIQGASVSDLTVTAAFMGTLSYMSPEQTRQEPVDHRTDIWAVGVVLYEMATGRAPFLGGSVKAILDAIRQADPPPLTSVRPDAPLELERIVNKTLQKRPADRYQHLDNMLVDLRLLRSQLDAESASPAPTTYRSVASIAVLPFDNLSGDPEQEFFCDGIAEEIINALTRVEGLHVVARSSSFAFKGKNVDIREIGRKLNVRAVLEGSVRKSGATLRISAQLVSVVDGYQLWSEQYDREVGDIFVVQDEIALAIVNTHAVQLMGRQGAPSPRRHTRNVAAYTQYLKGRFHWNKRTEEDMQRGIECFERSIRKDPSYALAYAGLADCFNIQGYYCALSPQETFPKAKANAVQALEIDDSLAEAHTSLAFPTLLYDWDWSSAERGFQRALALSPEYSTAHHWYSEQLALMGRMDEAIDVAKRVLALDPLSLIINTLVGWVHYYARDYDKAIAKLEEVLELEPDFIPAHLWLGLAQQQIGRIDAMVERLQKAIDLSDGSPLMWSALGRAYAAAGKSADVQAVLDLLEDQSGSAYVPPYHIAGIHAAAGRPDEAFGWLERALERRDHWVLFLKVDPTWDDLRPDPRFADLTRRIGLPD